MGTVTLDASGNLTFTATGSDTITVDPPATATKFGINVFNAQPASGTVIGQDVTAFLNQSIGGGAVTAYPWLTITVQGRTVLGHHPDRDMHHADLWVERDRCHRHHAFGAAAGRGGVQPRPDRRGARGSGGNRAPDRGRHRRAYCTAEESRMRPRGGATPSSAAGLRSMPSMNSRSASSAAT